MKYICTLYSEDKREVMHIKGSLDDILQVFEHFVCIMDLIKGSIDIKPYEDISG